jgi:lysozyme family protein
MKKLLHWLTQNTTGAVSAFLPPNESSYVFWYCVQYGNMRAIKLMQGCAGVPQDGLIGPMTRKKCSMLQKTVCIG